MIEVITNIDADHMETYGHDFSRLKQAFIEFTQRLPFYGIAVLWLVVIDGEANLQADAPEGEATARPKAMPRRYVVRWTPWSLAATGRPETALLWKGMLRSVRTVDRRGVLRMRSRLDYDIGYRHCVPSAPREEWFVGAGFLFRRGDAVAARARIRELLSKRIESQPLNLPNAGSVFRNPDGDHAARLIEACGLKGLAIGGAHRSPNLPEVPTLQEEGLAEFDLGSWYGLWFPAGTPRAIILRLHGELVRIAALPEVKQRFEEGGLVAMASHPDEFARFVERRSNLAEENHAGGEFQAELRKVGRTCVESIHREDKSGTGS